MVEEAAPIYYDRSRFDGKSSRFLAQINVEIKNVLSMMGWIESMPSSFPAQSQLTDSRVKLYCCGSKILSLINLYYMTKWKWTH